MTETATNRGWLLSNRMEAAVAKKQRRTAESAETLLYYQAQLEAELDEVRRRVAALIGSPGFSSQ